MKKILIGLLILVLAGFLFLVFSNYQKNQKIKKISTFEECAKLFPIMESYPARCTTPDGRWFVEKTAKLEEFVSAKGEVIRVEIDQNLSIGNPLVFSGQAKGNWFFEGSFPVKIEDSNGTIIAQKIATAQGEWMTTEFVNFTVSITYPVMQTGAGNIVLSKDNPSGLTGLDDWVKIPIVF